MSLPFDAAALSFTYDSHSHMLTYKGYPIGGAATLHRGGPRNGVMKQADLKLFRESAVREINSLCEGRGQSRFLEVIRRIDANT